MKDLIPILPLRLVIFPGSKYVVHLFEEKYIKLAQTCIRNNEGFGIVSIQEESPGLSDVGCYVEILKVLNVGLKGEMDVLIKGVRRFRTVYTRPNQDGYLEAMIYEYRDKRSGTANGFSEKVLIEKFMTILQKANLNIQESFWHNLDISKFKSYKIAEKAGLNLNQQQKILSLKTESERIDMLIEHFNNILHYLGENQTLKAIIESDGYIN